MPLRDRLRGAGVTVIGDGRGGMVLDAGAIAKPVARLLAAVREAEAAWFDLPEGVRKRLGKLAIVLDQRPEGTGIRKVPPDMPDDSEWPHPSERLEHP